MQKIRVPVAPFIFLPERSNPPLKGALIGIPGSTGNVGRIFGFRRPLAALASPILATVITGLFAFVCPQHDSVSAATAPTIIQQAAAVFSNHGAVSQLTLKGEVTWYSGGMTDTGSAVLTALADGSGSMVLSMQDRGNYSEIMQPVAAGRDCQWTDKSGTSHEMEPASCAIPLFPYLPSISLQPTTIFLTATDEGVGSIASTPTRILVINPVQNVTTSTPAASGPVQVGLDPATLLPSIVEYHIQPAANPMADIKVDISFADYVLQNGVQVPLSIQRRINGSLDLDIKIQSSSLQ